MGIVSLLAASSFITFNKAVAANVGIDEAILLGELCGLQTMYGEGFFYEQQKIMEDTCLSEYRFRQALNNLKKPEIVTIEKKGIPCKNHYTINKDKLVDLLNVLKTSYPKIQVTGYPKIEATINNKERIIKQDNNADAFQLCEGYLDRPLNTAEIKAISDWWLSAEMVEEAIRRAELNNVHSIVYIDRIINHWQDNGIETVRQAEIEKEQFDKRKNLPRREEKDSYHNEGYSCTDDIFEV